jgi:hypothetical protein
MPAADWGAFFIGSGQAVYEPPSEPGVRLLTLRMPDGGALRSFEVFYATHPELLRKYGTLGLSPTTRADWRITVAGSGPEQGVWIYEGPHYEKNMQAAVSKAGNENLCRQVAETLRQIDSSPEKLAAMLIEGPTFAAFPRAA